MNDAISSATCALKLRGHMAWQQVLGLFLVVGGLGMLRCGAVLQDGRPGSSQRVVLHLAHVSPPGSLALEASSLIINVPAVFEDANSFQAELRKALDTWEAYNRLLDRLEGALWALGSLEPGSSQRCLEERQRLLSLLEKVQHHQSWQPKELEGMHSMLLGKLLHEKHPSTNPADWAHYKTTVGRLINSARGFSVTISGGGAWPEEQRRWCARVLGQLSEEQVEINHLDIVNFAAPLGLTLAPAGEIAADQELSAVKGPWYTFTPRELTAVNVDSHTLALLFARLQIRLGGTVVLSGMSLLDFGAMAPADSWNLKRLVIRHVGAVVIPESWSGKHPVHLVCFSSEERSLCHSLKTSQLVIWEVGALRLSYSAVQPGCCQIDCVAAPGSTVIADTNLEIRVPRLAVYQSSVGVSGAREIDEIACWVTAACTRVKQVAVLVEGPEPGLPDHHQLEYVARRLSSRCSGFVLKIVAERDAELCLCRVVYVTLVPVAESDVELDSDAGSGSDCLSFKIDDRRLVHVSAACLAELGRSPRPIREALCGEAADAILVESLEKLIASPPTSCSFCPNPPASSQGSSLGFAGGSLDGEYVVLPCGEVFHSACFWRCIRAGQTAFVCSECSSTFLYSGELNYHLCKDEERGYGLTWSVDFPSATLDVPKSSWTLVPGSSVAVPPELDGLSGLEPDIPLI